MIAFPGAGAQIQTVRTTAVHEFSAVERDRDQAAAGEKRVLDSTTVAPSSSHQLRRRKYPRRCSSGVSLRITEEQTLKPNPLAQV